MKLAFFLILGRKSYLLSFFHPLQTKLKLNRGCASYAFILESNCNQDYSLGKKKYSPHVLINVTCHVMELRKICVGECF